MERVTGVGEGEGRSEGRGEERGEGEGEENIGSEKKWKRCRGSRGIKAAQKFCLSRTVDSGYPGL